MRPTYKKLGEYAGLLTVLVGVGWFVIQPRAQEFVNDTVEDKFGQVQESLDELDADGLKALLAQIRLEKDLEVLLTLQQESANTQRVILRLLLDARERDTPRVGIGAP